MGWTAPVGKKLKGDHSKWRMNNEGSKWAKGSSSGWKAGALQEWDDEQGSDWKGDEGDWQQGEGGWDGGGGDNDWQKNFGDSTDWDEGWR